MPRADAETSPYADDFGPFDGIWLDTAHQGALPAPAVEQLDRARAMKVDPAGISDDAFTEVPERLKHALALLVGASEDEIVLGNSASFGLHLLVDGIPWNDGDEVILVTGDF